MLNPTQEKILKSIKFYYRMFGFSPSIRDIAGLCEIKSMQYLYDNIQVLKENGYISMESNKPRTIKILS